MGAQETPGTQQKRPNLPFITTDDQRFDMIGIVNPVLQTPYMDRLADSIVATVDGIARRQAVSGLLCAPDGGPNARIPRPVCTERSRCLVLR